MRFATTLRAAIDTLPTAADLPDAGAVVLVDEQDVFYELKDAMPVARVEQRFRGRILQDGGRAIGQLYFFYDRKFSQVVDFHARIIKPDGQTKTFDRDDLIDQLAWAGSQLYVDNRLVSLDLTDCPLGTVVEYRFTELQTDPKLFQLRAAFGGRYPIVQSRLTVTFPEDWKVEHAAVQLSKPLDWPPAVSTTGSGQTKWVWEKQDVDAHRSEPLAPTYSDSVPIVAVRLASWTIDGVRTDSFADLRDLSKWLYKLQDGTDDTNAAMLALVAEIVAEAPSPRDKARRLYEWVQENIRYTGVQIGLGGWRPFSATEVFETRYGDCKAKANLLRSMLKTQKIDSSMASLYAHDGFPRDFLLPTLGNTNHAILMIHLPGGPVVVDPTTRTVPFGQLPLGDQEANLLEVRPEGALPIKLPASTPQDNLRTLRIRASLEDSGRGKGEYEIELFGSHASSLAGDLIGDNEGDRKKAVKRRLALRQGSVDSESVTSTGGQLVDGPLVAKGKLTLPNAAVVAGPARLIRLSELMESSAHKLAPGPRRAPIVMLRAERRVDEIDLELPGGFTAHALPEATVIEAPFARYELQWVLLDGRLKVSRTYELTQRILPASDYEALRSFFDRILAAEAKAVVLKK